jgi:hypothetical protein
MAQSAKAVHANANAFVAIDYPSYMEYLQQVGQRSPFRPAFTSPAESASGIACSC